VFKLSESSISAETLKQSLSNAAAGALATFEGWVRNHNDGKQVKQLEYQAYEPLAQKEAEKILQEARSQFDILDVHCLHRVGSLQIGDLAVWVGAIAAHRRDAFLACQYVIDQIKFRVPIWKKEHYLDGTTQWVNCAAHTHEHQANSSEAEFYSRQIQLPGISVSGQQALKKSRVLVVGAGGLGSSALLYLGGAGVGTLGICEADKLEASNLHRQVLYSHADIGQPKISLAAARIRKLNPYIEVVEHPCRLDAENAAGIVSAYDLVLDCTDNFKTKFLLNDICVQLKLPLVQASVYQYEGQIHLYRPGTPCLRCLWSETPDQNCFGSCADAGVLGAVPGMLGTMQAVEAIKLILKLPTVLDKHLLLFNLQTYATTLIKRTPRNDCLTCQPTPAAGATILAGVR